MKIEYHSFLDKINYYSGLLLVLSLPYNYLIQSIFAFCFVISGFILTDVKQFRQSILQNLLFLPLVLFFIIHIMGLLYTNNLKEGLSDLQVKIPFLVFPIVFCCNNNTKLLKNFNTVLAAFLASNFIASLLCITRAFYRIYITVQHDPGATFLKVGSNFFFYTEFSFLRHPSYFSMYIIFSIIILIYFLKKNIFCETRIRKNFFYILIPFFALIVILSASKAGILSLYIILSLFIFIEIRKRLLLKIAFIAVIFLSFVWIFNNSRFLDIKNLIRHPELIKQHDDTSSASTRIGIFNSSKKIIIKNFFFGVGTGNVHDELNKLYLANNMFLEKEHNLNAHDQYLETTIEIGLIGLLCLIALLVIPFIHSIRKNNKLLFYFIIICAINFLFESMLNRQAGVMPISFFYCLLLKISNNI